ncbi:MAG: Lrp/AsnC family transcriptional regulator [Bdellovibrionales bacterium]|nr:Lrp/AsnC family transcriptional regulator [Bdellovibrionales bacterium]
MSRVNDVNQCENSSIPTKWTPLQVQLLDQYQRGFPICERPYLKIAGELGVTEELVITEFQNLKNKGAISRIGPVFRPHALGTSTLAAMMIDPDKLESLAHLVSGFQEVNHNYERSDKMNLWFVVTAPNEAKLLEVLSEIESRTQIPVHDLRLLEEYRIDLGFDLSHWLSGRPE